MGEGVRMRLKNEVDASREMMTVREGYWHSNYRPQFARPGPLRFGQKLWHSPAANERGFSGRTPPSLPSRNACQAPEDALARTARKHQLQHHRTHCALTARLIAIHGPRKSPLCSTMCRRSPPR